MIKTKYYQLFQADALEWLEERQPESLHAVVTDPPFSLVEFSSQELAKRQNGKGIWRLPHNYDGHRRMPMPRFTVLNSSDHKRLQEFHHKLALLLIKVLVPGSHVFIASQNLLSHFVTASFYEAGFEVRGQVSRIVKTLRGGDRPKGAHDKYRDISVTPRTCWEPWLIFRKPCEGLVRENLEKWGTGALRRPREDTPFTDLITSSPTRPAERKIAPHPSIKPQNFMRQIVRAVLPLGRGTILDPFMGAGSTIAAAQFYNYKSIGVEINEEYFQMAKAAIPKLASLHMNDLSDQNCSEPSHVNK